MIEVAPGLHIGDQSNCGLVGYATVHACKFPCFWTEVGSRQPKPGEQSYLSTVIGRNLYLNLIDSDQSKYFQVQSFVIAMGFIDQRVAIGEKVLIHCNQGLSRAPVIALLWMARTGAVPSDITSATREFTARYPVFHPSTGISGFLAEHWNEIVPDQVVA